jgi:predicted 2-oxoglutarate/Fe(II)-dependent dioxygenase YbiX
MENNLILNQLLELQQFISSESAFLAKGQSEFAMLGMQIEGMGSVPLPLNESIAKQIIGIAQQAPYGKGHETLVDTNVRNTWEIEPPLIAYSNKKLASIVTNIVAELKEQLGIEHLQIDANFYKLLVYEPGSFFLKHKDSEKEKGMFGSLILTLPSTYSGGEFVIEFGGKKETIVHNQKDECINWVAFYADCDHEILPITEGYRLALVYNLITKDSKPKPFENIKGLAMALDVLKQKEFENIEQPIAMHLQHQYTETNFSLALLKGSDYTCASIMLEAAKHLGWYANVGLLEHTVLGMPDGDYYDDDIDPEFASMDEVIDESESMIDWAFKPSLGNINIDEFIHINEINYDEEEPLEKESEGYMGNYGPELTFTYRNSILILAPPKVLPKLLNEIRFKEQLEWIDFYINNEPIDMKNIEHLYRCLNWTSNYNDEVNFDGVFKLWIENKNLFLLDEKAYNKFAISICDSYINLVASFMVCIPLKKMKEIIVYCLQHKNDKVVVKIYEVINYFFTNNSKFGIDAELIELTLQYYRIQRALSTQFEILVIEYLFNIYKIKEFDVNFFNEGNARKVTRHWIYNIAMHTLERTTISKRF